MKNRIVKAIKDTQLINDIKNKFKDFSVLIDKLDYDDETSNIIETYKNDLINLINKINKDNVEQVLEEVKDIVEDVVDEINIPTNVENKIDNIIEETEDIVEEINKDIDNSDVDKLYELLKNDPNFDEDINKDILPDYLQYFKNFQQAYDFYHKAMKLAKDNILDGDLYGYHLIREIEFLKTRLNDCGFTIDQVLHDQYKLIELLGGYEDQPLCIYKWMKTFTDPNVFLNHEYEYVYRYLNDYSDDNLADYIFTTAAMENTIKNMNPKDALNMCNYIIHLEQFDQLSKEELKQKVIKKYFQ